MEMIKTKSKFAKSLLHKNSKKTSRITILGSLLFALCSCGLEQVPQVDESRHKKNTAEVNISDQHEYKLDNGQIDFEAFDQDAYAKEQEREEQLRRFGEQIGIEDLPSVIEDQRLIEIREREEEERRIAEEYQQMRKDELEARRAEEIERFNNQAEQNEQFYTEEYVDPIIRNMEENGVGFINTAVLAEREILRDLAMAASQIANIARNPNAAVELFTGGIVDSYEENLDDLSQTGADNESLITRAQAGALTIPGVEGVAEYLGQTSMDADPAETYRIQNENALDAFLGFVADSLTVIDTILPAATAIDNLATNLNRNARNIGGIDAPSGPNGGIRTDPKIDGPIDESYVDAPTGPSRLNKSDRLIDQEIDVDGQSITVTKVNIDSNTRNSEFTNTESTVVTTTVADGDGNLVEIGSTTVIPKENGELYINGVDIDPAAQGRGLSEDQLRGALDVYPETTSISAKLNDDNLNVYNLAMDGGGEYKGFTIADANGDPAVALMETPAYKVRRNLGFTEIELADFDYIDPGDSLIPLKTTRSP